MAINASPQFAQDRQRYIQGQTLRLTQKRLCAYQFAEKLKLPEGFGATYTATRFERLPLPFAPLSEGVPSAGENMTITQVSATAQQWGDSVIVTDVSELTIMHKPFQQAIRLCALAISETRERNTYLSLLGAPQVDYVNARGSRGALQSGDVLDPHTMNRMVASLTTIGAPQFGGPKEDDIKMDAGKGQPKAGADPMTRPHWVAIMHPLMAADFKENSTVVLAWSYSDINHLYNFEVGMWSNVRFCESNLVPSWTGQSQSAGSPGSAGSLATASYYIVVTGQDTQNQFESQIYSVSNAISVTGPTGSISVTTPNVPGYLYNVYIGTSATLTPNLALSPSGPTTGPLTGCATQIPSNTTITLTGVGPARTPPAYPGNTSGLTVFPCFVFGDEAYGIVELDTLDMEYLDKADKSDPHNQKRVVAWKYFEGVLIMNSQFLGRIEGTSAFSATFG